MHFVTCMCYTCFLRGNAMTQQNNSQIIIYQTEAGQTKIEVRLENETVWLTQDQMAQLFGKAKSTINEHIKNTFAEGELQEYAVMKKFGNSEFQQKSPNFYNLDVRFIIFLMELCRTNRQC